MEMKDWLGPFLGFGGGVIVTSLNYHLSSRTRLLDAYVELAGAAMGLYHVAIEYAFRQGKTDKAWLRFGIARARLLLQEQDPHCLKEIDDLKAALDQLYSVEVYLEGGPITEEEERKERAKKLTADMQVVKGQVDQLLRNAKRRLGPWWKFWA